MNYLYLEMMTIILVFHTFLSLFTNIVGVLLVGLFICMDEDMLYI